MSTADAPRRLRAQDVIDHLQHTIEQLTTRSAEPSVAVELVRNAKGETQISAKVTVLGGTAPSLVSAAGSVAYDEAMRLYDAACAKYPTGSGFSRNEGQPTTE